MRGGADLVAEQDLHHRSGATATRRLGATRLRFVDVPLDLRDAIAQTYRLSSLVESVEGDKATRSAWVPNDPQLTKQWALWTIGAPAAWDVTNHGSTSARVAVLDSGISVSNPDLAGRVAQSADFTGSGQGDRFGHGTAVAGVIAAGFDNGVGIAGLTSARLLDGKVLDDSGLGTESQLLDAIVWASDQGARVINLSVGTDSGCSTAMQTSIDYAWSNGAVLVAAAGNSGSRSLASPASCNHVLAVAATDSGDGRASFSNYGPGVSIAAPGVGILTPNLGGGDSSQDGTSFAAAHVSGAAALVWSTRYGGSNQAVVDRLLNTAKPVPGTGVLWRAGRLDLGAAVGASPSPTPTSVTTGTPTLTPSPTNTPTVAPSATSTPTATASQTTTATSTPAADATPTSTGTATPPTLTPTATPTEPVIYPLGCGNSYSISLSSASVTMSPNVDPSASTDATTSSPTPLQATLSVGNSCATWSLSANLPANSLPANTVYATCNGGPYVALSTTSTSVCNNTTTGLFNVTITYKIQNSWALTNQTTTLSSITWSIGP